MLKLSPSLRVDADDGAGGAGPSAMEIETEMEIEGQVQVQCRERPLVQLCGARLHKVECTPKVSIREAQTSAAMFLSSDQAMGDEAMRR